MVRKTQTGQYQEALQNMRYFCHQTANAQSSRIGVSTRILQFPVILPNAQIGADCNICVHVLIENDVVVGDRVTVNSGVQLWEGILIEDDVFIGPNVTLTNETRTRKKQYPTDFALTIVKTSASIGGEGNPTARHNNRTRSYGGRSCRGNQIHPRGCIGGGQPCSNGAIHRGVQ